MNELAYNFKMWRKTGWRKKHRQEFDAMTFKQLDTLIEYLELASKRLVWGANQRLARKNINYLKSINIAPKATKDSGGDPNNADQ